MFSHHASVFRIGKNPIAPIIFTQSVTLSVLSVLIGQSMLHSLATGDISTSVCEPHRQSARARAETDQFTALQLFLQAQRTMAGNRETSEGVPVGRTTLKTRAAAHLVRVDTGPPPCAGGTGLFKTLISLLFDLF